ncbi:hypothetical protein GCM10009799_46180 [Nocardiopsis rhodophaea]|uniref:Peptidase S1 domain-containing protein n=1 Tax=Nocardiopsis rhodophaea TaxID=280238 RepID=A0ABP5EZJ6_9ACTN
MRPLSQSLRLLGLSLLALGLLLALSPTAAAHTTVTAAARGIDEPTRIIAGDPIFSGTVSRCSIGAAVRTATGTGGFLTAYPCGRPGDVVRSPDGTYGTVRWVDPELGVAFVETDEDWILTPHVRTSPGGALKTIDGSREAPIGASLCRSGSTTGWHCGTIQAKNQDVRFTWGTVIGLTRTSVCAEPGDTGGPFISGSQLQGILLGGGGSCRTGGYTYFVPINPVLAKYRLMLVTV